MMQARQLVIVAGKENWLSTEFRTQKFTSIAIFQHPTQLKIAELAGDYFLFHQAKNALGQEWDCIVYDCRVSLNLEALAIAAGTLRAGGVLYFWINDIQTFIDEIDLDSLRWADGNCQPRPQFRKFFANLLASFAFPIIQQPSSIPFNSPQKCPVSNHTPTADQQTLLTQILAQPQSRFFLIAKRGRGKSALAGMLANQVLHQDPDALLLTAANKKAVQTLQKFCKLKIPFIAPDALIASLKQTQLKAKWLFIDEAAMLPLPMLHSLVTAFPNVLCITTIDSYEGTGQGFALKFMQTHQDFQTLTLNAPLRWQPQDPVEDFIEKLLVLGSQPTLILSQTVHWDYQFLSNSANSSELIAFYQCLKQAHYRTTPLDLSRLFDAPNQHFFVARNPQIQGGIWAITEGNLHNDNLLNAIRRGERRPIGNLVAQLLLQQYLFSEVCRLRSLRISRIAINPTFQNQGYGTTLLRKFCQQCQQQEMDFISVSFGFTAKLAKFWHDAGFQLTYLSPHQTASSGCYSAVFLYPISAQGQKLCHQIIASFQRNFPLSDHPLFAEIASLITFEEIDWQLNEIDWQILADFAYGQRGFYASLPSLKRLNQCVGIDIDFIVPKFNQNEWLQNCRKEVRRVLEKE